MKVKFIGTGEAFDDKVANVSILIESKTKLLIDCGYNSFKEFFRACPDPNYVDTIYLTHFHGDHALLPPYFMRLRADKRTKPLLIIGQKGIEDFVKSQFKLLYPGFYEAIKKQFDLNYKEIDSNESFQCNELKLKFFEVKHVVRTLAIRVSDGASSVVYTGDLTAEIKVTDFAKDVGLLIHEAFTPKSANIIVHCNATEAAQVAKDANVKKLALVHISKSSNKEEILKEAKEIFENTIAPNDGDEVEI